MNKKAFSFEISSTLPCRKDMLWEHIVKMPNINKELMPYMRMTYPAEMAGLTGGEAIPFGKTLFVSVILLFGIIPIDLHWLRLDNLIEGKAFYENSTTLLNRTWKHTRSLVDKGNGKTELTDELEFMPRIGFMGYIVLHIVKFIFRHRHQQLRRTFG